MSLEEVTNPEDFKNILKQIEMQMTRLHDLDLDNKQRFLAAIDYLRGEKTESLNTRDYLNELERALAPYDSTRVKSELEAKLEAIRLIGVLRSTLTLTKPESF